MSRSSLTGALAVLVVLSACQSPAPRDSATPPVPLRLLESRSLTLPESCRAEGSVIVDFTVLASGQTDDIRPGDAPDCVQQALSAWVASFRYAPIAESTPASVEWLLVEARAGS